MRKVDGSDCLRPSVSAFSVKPGQQGRSSPARVRSLRRLQKHLIEVLTLSIPHGMWSFRRPRGICFLAAVLMVLQKSWYARSTSDVSGGNKLLASWLVRALQWLHLALRKFHRLTGILGADRVSLGGTMSEGRCCDLGNFSKIRLSGKRLSGPTLTNARSGLVPVFQRPSGKWPCPLGHGEGQDH